MIAVFLLIVVLPQVIENGEAGAAILTVVIAAVLLLVGVISREGDRAYVNRMHYWANKDKGKDDPYR